MQPGTDDAKVLLDGVSLEQFAGVMAAVAERIELADVLAQEWIAGTSWPAAERAWRMAIAESTPFQMELIRRRREAEECLGRKVAPLEDDASAWMGLLGALATSPDPNGLIEALGLTMGDVARLGRHWKRKIASDGSLAKKLEDLAATAKPPAAVSVGRTVLRPFPWTKRKPENEVTAGAGAAPSPRSPSPEVGATRESLVVSHEAALPARQFASYQLGRPDAPRAGVVSNDAAGAADLLGSETHMMPRTEEVQRLIAEAQRAAAMARAAAALPEMPERVLPGPTPRDDPFDETKALPRPAEILRRIAEADPRAAMARAVAHPSIDPIGAQTAPTDRSALLAAVGALPFRPGEAAVARAAAPVPERVPTGTEGITPEQIAAALDASRRSNAAPKPPLDDPPLKWPLEAYARLSVDLQVRPLETVLREYGITQEERMALDVYWHERATDPVVRERWARASEHYRRGRYGV